LVVDVDRSQRDQCLAGTAFRDHHGGARLLPAFGDPHDGDGLCRERRSQQSFNPRRYTIVELVERWILLKNALSQERSVGAHICEDAGLFRPHYVTWSEQRIIEAHAPEYLRNIVKIITETGLRVYKELMPMKKEQLDLCESDGLDSGFQDSERSGRGTVDTLGPRSVPRSDAIVAMQSVSVSER
jgi:hypothetical protein